MGKPHVIMVPYPMQGHVIPLMELGQLLAKHGVIVTFVNTEVIHESIIKALPDINNNTVDERIRLVSIPDGLDSLERSVREKSVVAHCQALPKRIEELIVKINGSDEDKITCVVYDHVLSRIGEVAKSRRVGSVAFSSAPASLLLLGFNIPKLIEGGIIDHEGSPLKNQTLQFDPTNPIINTEELHWTTAKHLPLQKVVFNNLTENTELTKSADWLLCNSVYNLEPGAFSLIPHVIPIGPLLSSSELGISAGHLWEQDYTCLEWLNRQKINSVIYVAFGSTTNFSLDQFQEFALGLELTNRPFLWAARPDIVIGPEAKQVFPAGFLDRVSSRGLVVGWAPQQKVLCHPSVACFVSHCGWNSTMESLSSGVPLLCWPYFADQFMNKSYICDIWKVGLGFEDNGSGIITSEEVKNKVEKLLDDGIFRERALHVKETIESGARQGGNSHKNITNFINWVKG